LKVEESFLFKGWIGPPLWKRRASGLAILLAVGGVGSRVFDLYCNGTALLRNFDIFEGAGGTLAPADKTFHNVEPNAEAKLALSFVPARDYARVNDIEVSAGRRA
jgi:hypothetical protein